MEKFSLDGHYEMEYGTEEKFSGLIDVDEQGFFRGTLTYDLESSCRKNSQCVKGRIEKGKRKGIFFVQSPNEVDFIRLLYKLRKDSVQEEIEGGYKGECGEEWKLSKKDADAYYKNELITGRGAKIGRSLRGKAQITLKKKG